MAELWSTSRLLLTILGGILCQLFSASATLCVLNNVTWDTAFYTCHQHGEQLYSTSDITSLSDVTAGSYWIGAKVQYSSWMWTGEVTESQSVQFYQISYDNQASRCYYECQQHETTAGVMYVGLQREKCYCFNWISWNQLPHGHVERENKTGCLGNFKENCGTENTISIYTTEFTTDLGVRGLCGYVETDLSLLILKAGENCDTKKGFICNCPGQYSNNSCYNHGMNDSWFLSNSSCVLAKLNTRETETIKQKLWWEGGEQYWIGLKRYKQIVWTGSHFNETMNINITQNGCVLLEKLSNGKISFSISNCSTHHSAICIIIPRFSEITTSIEDKNVFESSASEKSGRETTPFTSVTNSIFRTPNIPSSETNKTIPAPGSSEITSKEIKNVFESSASENSESETTPFTYAPSADVTKSQILNEDRKDQTDHINFV